MHALIIGGGPAGAVAGLLLARCQWRVTIVEQHAFPRDKVCGECLSPTGIDVLDRAGMLDLLQSAGAVTLTHTRLHPAKGEPARLGLPRPCLGVSRRTMDALLLAAADDAGATLRQPARCEKLVPGQLACHVRDLVSNEIERISADVILLADGKGALIDPKPPPTADLGVKARFTHVNGPRDAVELFALDGHYVGLNPIEAAGWNLAMSVPADRVRRLRGNFDHLLTTMLQTSAGLARRLADARRTTPWMAAPLPRFAVTPKSCIDNLLPIGNAAAALEPIGGEGMGLALRSAEIAVNEIIAARQAGQPARFARIAPRFAALWRTRTRACRAAALALSNPTTADATLQLLAANPPLQRATLRLIGK